MTKKGSELKVGDLIEMNLWSQPRYDMIIEIIPYHGPIESLWDAKGGARLAKFAITKPGMTIAGDDLFEVLEPGQGVPPGKQKGADKKLS